MTVRSRQVSGELRRLRKQAGLTSDEAAKRLGISQSKISRMENGQAGLHADEVAALLGVYHTDAGNRERLLGLVREAEQSGLVAMHGENLPEQWQALIDWESRAAALRNYEPLGVPGLLQTSDYARAIIQGTEINQLTDTKLDERVSARLGRQGILSRALPPELHVVLHEPVLHLPVGSREVMAGQLRALLEFARRPRVTIQVVPMIAGPHPGLEGPFVVLDFAADPTLVYLENRAVSIFLEDERQIESYRLAWRAILAKALPERRSLEVIAAELARHDKERS